MLEPSIYEVPPNDVALPIVEIRDSNHFFYRVAYLHGQIRLKLTSIMVFACAKILRLWDKQEPGFFV